MLRIENKLHAPTHLVTSDRMTKMGGVYAYHRKGRRANRGETGPDTRTTGEEAILGKTSITTPLLVGSKRVSITYATDASTVNM